ncbi:MAG: PLP-dependent aminotransferase family protein, partial [Acidobacteriaceae bacterium]|nr:PLP-dependent aminotransferase family protein [Acidobacteriaceae bacterium]
MLAITGLDSNAGAPLYRQLYSKIKELIDSGEIADGDRLPPTRELAGSLGLNRTTVSAAYDLLESDGLIKGHVGRGSFVSAGNKALISFSTSRPSEALFPMDAFRATCSEVIQSEAAASILQLGSPSGYAPLRRYLHDSGQAEGTFREHDEILITSGCQQAFDLLQRVLAASGETVLVEDPVIPGLRNAFSRAGARLLGIPMTEEGIDLGALERMLGRERPALIVVTPNYQNPTGFTMPVERRKQLLDLVRSSGTRLVENDIYGDLRYEGDALPTLKQLDDTGETILLRSFSKLAFPGLRVGWVTGPRALIERLTEAKQWTDLHTDQLSQAVLFRFAQSGRLEAHRRRMLTAGRERLQAAVEACGKFLPAGTQFTKPQGGMNLWVRLPEPLDAGELLARAEREGVTYLP